MNSSSRLLRVILAAGLLVSLLAATIAPVAAQPDPPSSDPPFVFQNPPMAFAGNGTNVIYYPWVANGDNFGLGESRTSISVQNLENVDGQVWIYRGDGNNGWVYATTAQLNAWAAKTFTAAQLGITGGAPVAVVGYTSVAIDVPGDALPWTGDVPSSNQTFTETVVVLSNPLDGSEGQAQVVACVANNAAGNPSPFRWGLAGVPDLGASGASFVLGSDGNYWVTWSNQGQLQAILDHVNAAATSLVNPFGGLNSDGDCNDSLSYSADGVTFNNSLTIGGTAFQTAAADGTATTATSGYNAINGLEVDTFNQWYLPIVQTNCGPGGCWDSVVRVANLSSNNSAVTVRFFPADDGSGSLQTGFQLQELVQGGETWNINLGDWVPEGWVGAAHVYSDGAVFAMVDRYKVGYDMWITNTGSSADFENRAQYPTNSQQGDYVLFAPHVLVDYFGWNTGINVANLVDWDNNVSIQYFNMLGNATQGLSQRLAAHGMTYFYDPSDAGQNWSSQDPATDPNAGIVASALIWSDYPVAAVVDATKYPETDPRMGADVFQATSYSATQNVYPWQAVPYVTKGQATDGSGATSGINFMNPNNVAVVIDVYWVNPSGFNASNFGTSTVSIPAFANGFVYTLWQHNLPNGFTGAAVAISRGGAPIVAASANVNYDIDGDGAVIYNGFNPCGFYRTVNDTSRAPSQMVEGYYHLCGYQETPPIGGEPNSITAAAVAPGGEHLLPGTPVLLFDTTCAAASVPGGPEAIREAVLGADGTFEFTDLEPGTYCVALVIDQQGDLEPASPTQIDVILGPDQGLTVTFALEYVGMIMIWNSDCPADASTSWVPNGSTVTEVATGTNGITSPNGVCHTNIVNLGAFTRYAGYSNQFGNGFVKTVEIYLDTTWALGQGLDFTAAVSDQSPNNHRRDFIFHVTKDTSTGQLLVGGSNNTNNVPREDLENGNHYVVTTSGWYTFQHVFRDQGGVLAVDLNLIDSNGNVVFTETRSDPTDLIATIVGGSRYGWFTANNVAGGVKVGSHTLSLVQ